MKNLILTLGLVFLLGSFINIGSAISGDLGGGGSLGAQGGKDFILKEQKKNLLMTQENAQEAFYIWASTLSEQEQERVLKEVFDKHILPQLK